MTEHGSVLVLFDKTEPRSLINIVWQDFVPILEMMERGHQELLQKNEYKLRAKLKPTPMHDMLRLRFWQTYDSAQMNNAKMVQAHVTRGVCPAEYWSKDVCKNPVALAYILIPMSEYKVRMESALTIAMDEIDGILRLPLMQKRINRKGETIEELDTKLLAAKVAIWEKLDVRVKGAVMQKVAIHQRIDQHTQITNGVDPIERMELNDLQALDRRLASVKKQIDRAQSRELISLPVPKEEEVLDVTEAGSLPDHLYGAETPPPASQEADAEEAREENASLDTKGTDDF